MIRKNKIICPICGTKELNQIFNYTKPPVGEIHFSFCENTPYHRIVWRCIQCGHYISHHDMDDRMLYTGDYVNANYQNDTGLLNAYKRILSLPPAESDNVGRVQRILEFTSKHGFATNHRPSVLDVGSGLCVFLNGMKAAGWDCTALDPDPRAASHAKNTIGINVICGDFLKVQDRSQFDLVTFNKVLEHVIDPAAMLTKAKEFLNPRGIIYIEVPDGEVAAQHGSGREEFFIDHRGIFSFASLALLIKKCEMEAISMARLHEPSSKFTLYAFLAPKFSQGFITR